jgi:hypothetical protein
VKRRWFAAIFLAAVAMVLLGLWLTRAYIAVQFARSYFNGHGIHSNVEIGALGFAGLSGRFALGPEGAPEISADGIELRFDPLRWLPYVVEVRLVHPVVRAGIDESGRPSLGSLQAWIDSLGKQQGKSQFVGEDLAVSLTGLRLLLSTPGGPLEVDGDVKLVKNLPVSMALQVKPAAIAYRETKIAMRAASLAYDQKSGVVSARFSGSVSHAVLQARDVEADIRAGNFRWASANGKISVSAPEVTFKASAVSMQAGQNVSAPKLDVAARNLAIASADAGMEGSAEMTVNGEAGFNAGFDALRSADPALAAALRKNIARLSLHFSGHAERRNGMTHFALTQPLQVKGTQGAVLDVPALTLSGAQNGVNAALQANFGGPGLPAAKLAVKNLMWSGGGFTANAAFSARFNFAMLRGTDLAGQGRFSWQNGQYAFTPSGCVRATLTAFHPGASDLAKNVRGDLCASPNQPLLTGEGIGWTLTGLAREASADLPLAIAHAENVAARLAFDGEGAPLKGTATVTAAQISDRAASLRFKPLAATGTASLGKGVWTGRFAVTDPKQTALGETTFTHTMATGIGTAHIEAPHISFALDHLQPGDLSPLLVAFRRAEGSAALTGDIDWTRDAITSRGKLSIASLDFLTPLGKAHTVKSEINFTSLLPPITAPGQSLSISRIDWTLPFSAVDVRFGFSPTTIQVAKADTDIAQGHASLGAITVAVADPGHVAGAAQLSGIALNSLVAASNLGNKVKLEGKVSGRIPFETGPDGFRIVNGHVAADGPGRLSVDRSLWAQGEAAISSNAVQDFAYQALENLAFEQMSADLNSVANGRLQVVFHIKGRSDPPKRQVAEVAITDVINGTALYKPIPLPSGTPIDLTLDTSLNFDELLKSYAEAWSKSLSPEGHPDTPSPGAKP